MLKLEKRFEKPIESLPRKPTRMLSEAGQQVDHIGLYTVSRSFLVRFNVKTEKHW